MNIIVLDLNPLYDVITNREYKEKYYKSLMPLSIKYAELLPWGGKLTGESLRFFSPIVIWTRFSTSQDKHDILFDAFSDYYKTWLDLMEQAVEETAADQIMLNSEAQHKYLTWRAEKDPGHPMLKRLLGEDKARNLLRSFLFNGVDEIGNKTFLDYFPGYKLDDETLNEKRSIMGKSFENRPWDSRGELIDNC
uniref:Phytochromobilin:ferredoxin oxidoreductase, chloroplastic n=2 Tax=Chenopodium quinoa TaxID=63459 RepID=A0A803LM55_CHEQI